MSKKQHVNLNEEEQVYLKELVGKGDLASKTSRRAFSLLLLNRGETYKDVAETIGVAQQTVSVWAKKYHETGFEFLEDKARPGRPKKIQSVDEARVTALACSDPPEGYSQWSLRLLADHAVELIEADSISYSGVRRILKKTNSNPT